MTAVPEREPGPRGWRRWRAPMIVIVSIGLVAIVGYLMLPFGKPGQATITTGAAPEFSVPGLDIREVGSWAQIRPARSPGFCLAEGKDRTQAYPNPIVAQQLCGQAASPRVFIDPVGEANAVQIQWHHPETGVGCLTVVNDGMGHDLVEPRDECDDDGSDQLFTIDQTGRPEAGHFLIRPVGTAQCLGLRDQDTAAGTEIVRERCSGAPDQEFLIDLIPPP